jgi:hypothetical protein
MTKLSRTITLDLGGRLVVAPTEAPILYYVETFKPACKVLPHQVHVTSDKGTAWAFLAGSLVPDGEGHVVAYDISQAEKEAPKRLECLGRFTYDDRDKIPGQG